MMKEKVEIVHLTYEIITKRAFSNFIKMSLMVFDSNIWRISNYNIKTTICKYVIEP